MKTTRAIFVFRLAGGAAMAGGIWMALFGCRAGNKTNTSAASVEKVRANLAVAHTSADQMPRLLSQVAVFDDLHSLKPAAGLIAYDINVPFWSDGAIKQRWIAMPPHGEIRFAREGDWAFPQGTVFIKHFAMPGEGQAEPRRIETRVLVCEGDGKVHGASYKWRADASDADRVEQPVVETIDEGIAAKKWYFPGQNDCRTCHTQPSGGVLGVKTRQINRSFGADGENQLLTWKRRGFFSDDTNAPTPADILQLAQLARADDASRSVEDRARSFLDVNCSNCHRPNGVAANFDARFDTPLAQQNLIDGPVLINFGIDRARVIAPNDPWRSIALLRVETSDRTKMPPIAHQMVDQQSARLLRKWIASLPGPPVLAPPTIEPAGGSFARAVKVVLQEPTPGATIRYTLDGQAPNNSSPIYSAPIELNSPATVRARAFKDGMTRSIPAQATFIVSP